MRYKFGRLTSCYSISVSAINSRGNNGNHNCLPGLFADLQHCGCNWCHLLHMDISHRVDRYLD